MGFADMVNRKINLSEQYDAILNNRVKEEDGVTSYYREDESLISQRFDEDGNEIDEKVVNYYQNGEIYERNYDNNDGELLEAIKYAEDGSVEDKFEYNEDMKYYQ